MTNYEATNWSLLFLTAILAGMTAPPPAARGADADYDVLRDVAYARRGDLALRADVYRPTGKGPFPAVLCIHGGAWTFGTKSQMAGIAEQLAEHGYAAVAINYRLAPQFKFPAQIDDCRAALQWMRQHAAEYKIDADRLAAWGYSAGGHLAALLGATGAGLQAVVPGGAPLDFDYLGQQNDRLAFWLGGTASQVPEVYKAASALRAVSAGAPPMFLYTGQCDHVVHTEQAEAMAARLKQLGVEVAIYIVPDAGHIRAFADKQARAKAIEFLDEHLRKPAAVR